MIINEEKILEKKIRTEVLELMRHAVQLGDMAYAKELGELSKQSKARL